MVMSEEELVPDSSARAPEDGTLREKEYYLAACMGISLRALEVSAASAAAGQATAALAIHRIPRRWCLWAFSYASGSRSLGSLSRQKWPNCHTAAETVGWWRGDGRETRWLASLALAGRHGCCSRPRMRRSWLAPREGASVLRATCPRWRIGEIDGGCELRQGEGITCERAATSFTSWLGTAPTGIGG